MLWINEIFKAELADDQPGPSGIITRKCAQSAAKIGEQSGPSVENQADHEKVTNIDNGAIGPGNTNSSENLNPNDASPKNRDGRKNSADVDSEDENEKTIDPVKLFLDRV